MSVRCVVGRAGSGKTHRCLEAIRARLRENPADGPRLLLIVPEQASFQMERALIETPDIAGFTRCEVLSFQRLAYRIFATTGADPRRTDQTIGELGRLMAVRRLIRREKAALRVFGSVADKPGVVRQLSDTFTELMHEDVQPTSLVELAEKLADDNPLASAKVTDLVRLFEAYLEYLIDERMDPAQYLDLAATRMDQCDWLSGAEVWVDGFAGFTRQEYWLLAELGKRTSAMEVTLLVDSQASAIEKDELPALSYSLFGRTERTLVRLKRELRTAGVQWAKPVRLNDDGPGRFKAEPLRRLEVNFFRNSGEAGIGDEHSVDDDALQIYSFPDRRIEVEAAITEIQKLTQRADAPMRYRDIAIIVRNLDAYHDLISSAMRGLNIPCFIDRREPTCHHPLIELVRGLLSLAVEDCRMESARLLLKTGMVGLGGDEVDLLENYLLACGLRGWERWQEEWAYTRYFGRRRQGDELTDRQVIILRKINGLRRHMIGAIGPWMEEAVDQGPQPGRYWAERLFAALTQLRAGQQLLDWAEMAEKDGRTEEAQMHRQVWRDFVELLDEFVRALGTEPMRLEEFSETLESALAEFTLGLAPPTLDQVLVGSIERSRHPSIKAALLLGFDEQHFPLKSSENAMLGDTERELLAAAGAEIGPSRRQKLIDERMLAYIALTRASQRLWISIPRSDEGGQVVQPSPYLDEILAAGGVRMRRVDDPRTTRLPLFINSVNDLGGRLADEFRHRPALGDEALPKRRETYNYLYESVRGREGWSCSLKRGLAGLKYDNAARLAPCRVEGLFPKPMVLSVSQLEQFAACPFKHYADYLLRLDERCEAELATNELGSVCHFVLERFIGECIRQGRPIGQMEDDEIMEGVDRIAREMMPELAGEMMLNEERNLYQYDRSRYHLHRSLRRQRDAARAGRFQPNCVEYPFGMSGSDIAPLELTTPKGRKVHLRGKIDRVDVAELGGELLGMVVDYKTTKDKKFEWAKAYHGVALQLVGYLLALRETGQSLTGRPIRPVGAVYLSLTEPYMLLRNPQKDKKPALKYRGVLDVYGAELLDHALAEAGGNSEYYSATIKKDGGIHGRCDLMGENDFGALMRHVGLRMGELADRMLDGDVAVLPYWLKRYRPCQWCAYQAVCRFEMGLHGMNFLKGPGNTKKSAMSWVTGQEDGNE